LVLKKMKKNQVLVKSWKVSLRVPVMNSVEIIKVNNKKDREIFIRFPWEIYKNNPNWVPPLLFEVRAKLDPRKNPFFEHAEMELFLARRGERMVGRVAAIVDYRHNEYHREKVVFFGLYESLNDLEIARALLDTVAGWGRERGMETLRGPMNLSMNDECAFCWKVLTSRLSS